MGVIPHCTSSSFSQLPELQTTKHSNSCLNLLTEADGPFHPAKANAKGKNEGHLIIDPLIYSARVYIISLLTTWYITPLWPNCVGSVRKSAVESLPENWDESSEEIETTNPGTILQDERGLVELERGLRCACVELEPTQRNTKMPFRPGSLPN